MGKGKFGYGHNLARTRFLYFLDYVISLALVVKIRLRRKWSNESIAKCCIGVVICLLLYTCQDELLAKVETNPWYQQSNNKFSYNICTVSSVEGRRRHFITELELSKGKLPPSHLVSPIPEELRKRNQCYLPKDGFTSWKNGLVTELVQGRIPKMCDKLFTGKALNTKEKKWIDESNHLWKTGKNASSSLVTMTSDCDWVKSIFKDNFFVSDREKTFPIAYAINLDRHPHQILRFLKVIYRPHNLYCLHFDLKSSHTFKHIIFNLASCLDNVVVPRKIENVYRGWYTLVEAHASCFSDLLLARDRYPWRYVITVCGIELPLRTNAEIVSLLEPLDGMSSVKIMEPDKAFKQRYYFKWYLSTVTGRITMQDDHMSAVPYDMKIYKSWAYVALSHTHVEYYLCSNEGIAIRKYMRDAYIPEEMIYTMLFMKPGVPGGYRLEHKNKIFLVMSCIWTFRSSLLHYTRNLYQQITGQLKTPQNCSGKILHDICIVVAQDLARLSYKPGVSGDISTGGFDGPEGNYDGPDKGPIIHNKYIMDHDIVVMDCMEQELIRRNKLEYIQQCGRM